MIGLLVIVSIIRISSRSQNMNIWHLKIQRMFAVLCLGVIVLPHVCHLRKIQYCVYIIWHFLSLLSLQKSVATMLFCIVSEMKTDITKINKKHLKNVGPIRDCEPSHAHSAGVATGTVVRRVRIDVHDANDDDNDNA